MLYEVITERKILKDRHRRRVAVDGGRRAEDDILHPVRGHHFTEHQGAVNIVMIVEQRFLHRLADRLQPGEMDHRIERFGAAGKDRIQRRLIPQVDLVKGDLPAGQLGYPPQRLRP